MNEVENYRYQKLLNLIIFDSDPDYTDEQWLYSIKVLKDLKAIIQSYVKENYLGTIAISNIHKFLVGAREIKDEEYVERINITNDIIRLLNLQKKDESVIFYRIELYNRTREFKYLGTVPDHEIIDLITMVNDSICNDYVVLISHNSEVDDKTFIREYLEDLSTNELYYGSINSILKECPQVFKDLTFYNRVILTIESNEELNNYDNTLIERNNKIIKRINKKKAKK